MIIRDNTAVTEKPSCLRWSYGFTLHNVFSLWKGETELGLLTAGNGGSGAGSELVMMAAVHLMSLQAKKKKKKRHDRHGTIWNTTSLIHSCANPCWKKQHNVCQSVCFFLSTKTNSNAYIPIFHTANNQASDHHLILILYYSHIKDCCPMQSQTSSWSLIAIKSILHQDII